MTRKQSLTISQLNSGADHNSQFAEEPCARKRCAMSRTERIAIRDGRSSGQMTPR
jgi:hypothetical protein